MSYVVPEITSVTSESLQAEVRKLLPSQQGFTADLQATNVIVPIVDLTAAAEGTNVPVQLQEAQAFGSQTAFNCQNTTTTIANSPGFYKVQGTVTMIHGAAISDMTVNMTDGLSNKAIYKLNTLAATATLQMVSVKLDFTVFLGAGESVSAVSNSTNIAFAGSVRQIADVNGNLVNPSGFTPQ